MTEWSTSEKLEISPKKRFYVPDEQLDLNLRVRETSTRDSLLIETGLGPRTYEIRRIDVNVYTVEGEIRDEPSIFVDQRSTPTRMEATVRGNVSMFTDSTFSEYSIEVLDGTDSLGKTESRPVGIGYTAEFEQDGEIVRITRHDDVDPEWFVLFRIIHPDDRLQTLARIPVKNREEETFTIPLDALNFDPGAYPWVLELYEDREDERGERVIGISNFYNDDLVSIK